ncbi:TIGR02281 family clan AA aspartic protease [Sphingomonas sp. 1P06PA]|uniref:retropepsin-like aspartic protease family protein n=1 Tax=Sphingomonas sp. 1P06PA TaxID=554121 RepID=UPI0039A6EAF8
MNPDLLVEYRLPILIVAAILGLGLLRRVPILGRIVDVAVLLALAGGIVLAIDRLAPYDPTLAGLTAKLRPNAQQVVGSETRLQMAGDGHFWATVRLNGVERRMLIDSGASITALSPATAAAAGITPAESFPPVLLRTANGTVRAQTATVDELRIGNVLARDVPVVVAPGLGDFSVVGMNLLSRLKGWRVEGRTLVLTPNHPQAVSDEAASLGNKAVRRQERPA